jgi:cytochrome oxidase Cu insertion factor (SCO1/SenC/PrrC family)
LRPGQALALLLAAALAGGAASAYEQSGTSAAPKRLYQLPAAGSYLLPPIDRVSEHVLLDSDGQPAPLLGLTPGRFAIVAFVYLGCHDAAGCPLLLATLQQTDRRLAASPQLRDRVRLVTVSFDPSRDGPAEMAALRRALAPHADWRFFTSRDDAALQAALEDFGQDAVRELSRDGEGESALRHVAKVFLVDGEGRIRNVYSSGFLDADLLMRDLETLLGEHAPVS